MHRPTSKRIIQLVELAERDLAAEQPIELFDTPVGRGWTAEEFEYMCSAYEVVYRLRAKGED